MNQCDIRGKALSEFNDVEISGHDFIETSNYISYRDGKKITVQVLMCQECGYISEAWRYI